MITSALALALSSVTVFSSPGEGYDTFRIPALIETPELRGSQLGDRALLAFVEARQSQLDAANNTIVMKRGDITGTKWGPLQRIAEPPGGSYNNPCVVFSGTKLIMHFQHYPAGTHEFDVLPGFSGPRAVRGFQMESLDGGRTWSSPRDVTQQVKPEVAATIASGPGIGIELKHGEHKGRLLMPYNFRAGNRWWVYTAYSDDRGVNWKRGVQVVTPSRMNANEVQVAELADGSVMLNARNQAKDGFRCVALSQNGGESYSPAILDKQLTDPVCQGAFLSSVDGERTTLYFSNALDPKARRNGTLQVSDDLGVSWKKVATVELDSFQYSSIVKQRNSMVVLYEMMVDKRYQIKLKRIPLK